MDTCALPTATPQPRRRAGQAPHSADQSAALRSPVDAVPGVLVFGARSHALADVDCLERAGGGVNREAGAALGRHRCRSARRPPTPPKAAAAAARGGGAAATDPAPARATLGAHCSARGDDRHTHRLSADDQAPAPAVRVPAGSGKRGSSTEKRH